jgi:hypothetical protein
MNSGVVDTSPHLPQTEWAASNQKSRFMLDCIGSDTPPERVQHIEITVLGVHAGAAMLDSVGYCC